MNSLTKNILLLLPLFLLIIFVPFIITHYIEEDRAYEECMKKQALTICARQEKELADFSAWHPYVKCKNKESATRESLFPTYLSQEDVSIYIFNETEIYLCK